MLQFINKYLLNMSTIRKSMTNSSHLFHYNSHIDYQYRHRLPKITSIDTVGGPSPHHAPDYRVKLRKPKPKCMYNNCRGRESVNFTFTACNVVCPCVSSKCSFLRLNRYYFFSYLWDTKNDADFFPLH